MHAAACGYSNLIGHLTVLTSQYSAPPRPPAPKTPRPTLRRQLTLPAAPANPQQTNPQWPGKNNNNGPRGKNKNNAATNKKYQPENINTLVAALKKNK